jgi:hypothetical protein
MYYLVHREGGNYKKSFVKLLKKMNGAGVKRTPAQIYRKISKVDFVDLEAGWKRFILGLKTNDIPFWVVLRGDKDEMARFGLRPGDRITHLNGVRINNAAQYNRLWHERQKDRPTNMIVRENERDGGTQRAIRLPANTEVELGAYNSRSRHGSLRD